jgi:hypothetical protein
MDGVAIGVEMEVPASDGTETVSIDVEDQCRWTKRMSVVRMSIIRMNAGAEARPFHEVEGAGYRLISYEASVHNVSYECKA